MVKPTLFILNTTLTIYDILGNPSSSLMCLTHSPMMEGVCKPAKSCQSYQGFCENSGNVCCVGRMNCNIDLKQYLWI